MSSPQYVYFLSIYNLLETAKIQLFFAFDNLKAKKTMYLLESRGQVFDSGLDQRPVPLIPLYSNLRITSAGQLTIQSDVELMSNCQVIVEPGGKLIINGGTLSNVDLVLKPGATLQIINNGVLETRYGFEAPLGAIVDVQHGQIL